MEELQNLYEKHFYPSFDKFWKIVQQKQLDYSYRDVQNFINDQPITQIFHVKKKKGGHITAFSPKYKIQLDIVVMDKFGKSNQGNKYIFVCIDVFTRKAYAIPMKTKSIKDTSEALELFCERYFIPTIINSDNDSSFTGKEFQKIINKNNILMIENDLGKHEQLGVIDRFIQTLKNDIYKHFKFRNTTNWIDVLPNIINSYNDTPHGSIKNIRPQNAHLKENVKIIKQINLKKLFDGNNSLETQDEFKVGDKVRKKVRITFKNRSYNPNYSTEIFTIEKITGNKIFLKGLEKPVLSDELLLIPQDSIEDDNDALQEAIKMDKTRRALNKAGIDVSNIMIEKRRAKSDK